MYIHSLLSLCLVSDVLVMHMYDFPQVASGLTGPAKSGILALCEEVDSLSQQLSEMCRRGQGETPQAQAVARWGSAWLAGGHSEKYQILYQIT